MIEDHHSIVKRFPTKGKEYKPGTVFLEAGNLGEICIILGKYEAKNETEHGANMFRYSIVRFSSDDDTVTFHNFGWFLWEDSEILFDPE